MSDLMFSQTPEGIDIDFGPTMDGGFSTAVYLSLFAPLDWWGNEYLSDEEKIQGKLDALINSNRVLTNQTRLDAEEYARQALDWLPKYGAKSYTVTAVIPDTNTLGIIIDIVGPTGDLTKLRYGINWQNQEVKSW